MIYVIAAPTLRGPFKTRKAATFSGYMLAAKFDLVDLGEALIVHGITTIPRWRAV